VAAHGLELDRSLSLKDLGVSAFRGQNAELGRLGYFLQAIKKGIVPPGSFLLVESLDRISRQTVLSAIDTLRLILSEGVTLVTLTDGAAYTKGTIETNFPQLMMAFLTFARANEESSIKAMRVQEAWDRKKRDAATTPLTKVCPAWLRLRDDRSGFEVIPGRGEVVRRVFEMAAEGIGQHAIAAKLNTEGVPPFGDPRRKPGQHWHKSYVAKMLFGDAALGTYVPHSGQHVDGRIVRTPWAPVLGYYPAVVDHELARRARLVTGPGKNPKRGRHAALPVRNILAGLARCPLCDGTMTRVSKGSRAKAGKPYLVCAKAKAGAGCAYRAVPYEQVEVAILQRADELVLKDTLEDQDPELDAFLAEKADLVRRRENLLELVETGDASVRERFLSLGERLKAVEASVTDRTVHREANREPLVESRMGDLRAALKADPFDLEVANTALRLCADSVVVDYPAGDLLVSWRHGGVTDLTFAWPDE